MSQISVGRSKRRRQANCKFFAELLEHRTLLSSVLEGVGVNVYGPGIQTVASGFIADSLSGVVSGTQTSPPVGLGAANGDNFPGQPGFQNIPVTGGTFSVEWMSGVTYTGQPGEDIGGAPIATATGEPIPGTPDYEGAEGSVTVTLNESDAKAAGGPTGTYVDAITGATETYYWLVVEYSGTGWPTAWSAPDARINFADSTSQPKLAFIQNPSNTAAGDTIKPPVTVAVEDSSGNIATSASDTVSLAVASGSGTLSGTLSEAAVNGIATFSDLSIDKIDSYTLTATDTSSTSTTAATSSLFSITGGKLVFLKPVTGASAGDPIQPDIQVELQDGHNNVISSDSTTVVTLSPIGTTSANPITGNTATMVDGIATFSDVVLTKPGFYVLQAADGGDTTDVTGKFKVTGDKLVFITQPAPADVNAPFSVKVDIYNSKGVPDPNATTDLQLSLNSPAGVVGAVLAGTTTLAFSGGIAAFPLSAGLAINKPGNYTLTATEEEDSSGVLVPTNTTTPIKSKPFVVSPFHLFFSKPPTDTAVNAALTLTVEIRDVQNKVDMTDNLTAINIGFTTIPAGEPGQLLGTNIVNVVNGTAAFSATTNVIKFDTIGTYTLTADDGTDPVIPSKPIKIEGSHLDFSIPPHPANVNQPLQFAITEEDASGNTVTTDNSSLIGIRVVNAATGAPAQYTSDSSGVSPVLTEGLLNYGNAQIVSINQVGTFNITATAYSSVPTGGIAVPLGTIEPVTFKNLKVTGYKLAFIAKPPSTNAVNQPIPFTIAIKDDSKNINHADNATGLELSIKDYSGSANNSFTTNVALPVLSNGEAIFDVNQYFEIGEAGKYSLTVTAIDPFDNSVIATTKPVTSPVFVVTD